MSTTCCSKLPGVILEKADAKDLQSTQNNLKILTQLQTDINGKTEIRDELKQQFSRIRVDEKCQTVHEKLVEDFDAIFLLSESKKSELEESLKLYQFVSDANEEIEWCKEKSLLAKKEETGRDLAQGKGKRELTRII